jgi:hypothetical protein
MVRKTNAPNLAGTDTGVAARAARGWLKRLGKGTLLFLMLAVLAGAAGMYTFRLCPCPHFEKIEPASSPVPPKPAPDKDAKK